MLFNIAQAEVYLNGPQPATEATVGASNYSSLQSSSIPIILSWISALLGLIGFLLLIITFFLYILASGDEQKMAKSHNALVGSIFCLIGALVFYLIAYHFL